MCTKSEILKIGQIYMVMFTKWAKMLGHSKRTKVVQLRGIIVSGRLTHIRRSTKYLGQQDCECGIATQ